MDWFEITTADGEKCLINASAVMNIYYTTETDLTTINFIRSAYPSVYARGNLMTDIKRLLSAHDNYVSKIGG